MAVDILGSKNHNGGWQLAFQSSRGKNGLLERMARLIVI